MTPDVVDQAMQLALQHHQARRLPQAEQLYRQVLAQQPNHAVALHNLGVIAFQVGRHDAAVDLIRRAIALQPNNPAAWHNLGNALYSKGQADEAVSAYRGAVALDPNIPDVHMRLGIALTATGQPEEAISACRAAIALDPNIFEAQNSLGNALLARDQLDEAIAAYRQAVVLRPDRPGGYSNLGLALQGAGQLDEAITACRAAITLRPDFPEAHYNLALALLARGDLSQGWDEYEWRWKWKGFSSPRRNFPQPLWDGRRLAGARLLLHAEQGLGDTLQFIRYVPLAAQRGGKIIIECQPDLQRLIQPLAGECMIVAQRQQLPAFDLQCPLMSLPRVFGTTLETIPEQIPYLQADAAMGEQWRQRLGGNSDSLKVGLAWAGSKIQPNDRNRSMPLAALAPLGQFRGIRFFSLQKGERGEQAKNPPMGLDLIDWTGELNDFADTAALIANLDLVISVDTAVAHLAGAMGKPVWTLLCHVPDWRWLQAREDCPWYPTMRLFRQPSDGDWDSVVRRVADALARREIFPGRAT